MIEIVEVIHKLLSYSEAIAFKDFYTHFPSNLK